MNTPEICADCDGPLGDEWHEMQCLNGERYYLCESCAEKRWEAQEGVLWQNVDRSRRADND